MIIMHTANKAVFEAEIQTGNYGSESLERYGFIHCSDLDTYYLVAPNFRDDPAEKIILLIDTGKLDSEVRREDGGGLDFPHIYGLLNQEAIIGVYEHLLSKTGEWIPNDELKEYAVRGFRRPWECVAMRKMTGEEYRRFREYSVSDYAEDLIKGEGLDREQARKKAEAEFSGALPGGPDTDGQFLMAVESAKTGKEVGWIWFSYEEGDGGTRQVFLSDFLIYEAERRKGYAKAALREMERMAKNGGCAESVLYVWEHNIPAFSLYRECGYTAAGKGEGGIYMKKVL